MSAQDAVLVSMAREQARLRRHIVAARFSGLPGAILALLADHPAGLTAAEVRELSPVAKRASKACVATQLTRLKGLGYILLHTNKRKCPCCGYATGVYSLVEEEAVAS